MQKRRGPIKELGHYLEVVAQRTRDRKTGRGAD